MLMEHRLAIAPARLTGYWSARCACGYEASAGTEDECWQTLSDHALTFVVTDLRARGIDPYSPYESETLDSDSDNGTMVENVQKLATHVVGHRIVSVEKDVPRPDDAEFGWGRTSGTRITLDNGKQVWLIDTDDCCAFTELEQFLLHPDKVDHIITGIGTTEKYNVWHIYADAGDVLALTINWSAGNAFYYGYGFNIVVRDSDAEGNSPT